MICAWVVWTPATGFRWRGGKRKSIASLVKELVSVSRRRGWITILDDEVER